MAQATKSETVRVRFEDGREVNTTPAHARQLVKDKKAEIVKPGAKPAKPKGKGAGKGKAEGDGGE